MASLIPMDELTELKSASAVAAVANEAQSIQEEMSVAALINQAANCGQHSVTCNRVLSDEIKKKLENNGYKLIPNLRAADPEKSFVISGF